jgi:hypothetical protein
MLCGRGVDVDHTTILSWDPALCAGNGKTASLVSEATIDVTQVAGR